MYAVHRWRHGHVLDCSEFAFVMSHMSESWHIPICHGAYESILNCSVLCSTSCVCVCKCVCLCFCMSVCLHLCLCVWIWFCVSESVSVCLNLCLSVRVGVPVHIYVCLHEYVRACTSVPLCQCVCVYLYKSECVFVSLYLRVCLHRACMCKRLSVCACERAKERERETFCITSAYKSIFSTLHQAYRHSLLSPWVSN